jgi:hypothetical protein
MSRCCRIIYKDASGCFTIACTCADHADVAAACCHSSNDCMYLCCAEITGCAAAIAVAPCRYCCKACQVEHWKWHKALCKELSKPAPAAAAAAATAAAQYTCNG